MITLEKCENDTETTIKRIYHISDIHIRKYERYDEYNEVFEKLYNEIKNDPNPKEIIVVCTGDIFDAGLSSQAIILCKKLYISLSSICPIISIHGNHDQEMRTNDVKNILNPIISNLKTEFPIYILENSGVYIYKNLLFGYTGMHDKKVIDISTYIKNKDIKKKLKIGLYHGIIQGAKNNFDMVLSNNGHFGLKEFELFDIVMMGDVHKMQFFRQNQLWYASSIVQQNFGESLEHHGYMKYDVETKVATFHEIKNNYGFLTLKIKNNKIKNFDKDNNIPPNLNLKIQYEDTSDDFICDVYKKFQEKYNIISYIPEKIQKEYNYLDNQKENQKDNIINNNNNYNNSDIVLNNLVEYIQENTKYNDDEIKNMKEILENTIKLINYDNTKTKRNIKINLLSFNNFNIYGENNIVDFDLFKNKIINLNAKNGWGKSSFLQCIKYSIWGITEDSTISKYDYVNNKKNNLETKITLTINNKIYTIHRTADKNKRKHSVVLYENEKDISGKDLNSIEKQILSIIGTPEEIINLCIMDQKQVSSFVRLSDEEKKIFLCKILKLDTYNEIEKILSSEQNLLKRELQTIESYLYDDKKNKTGKKIELYNKHLEEYKIKLQDLINQEENINLTYNKISEEKIGLKIKLENYTDIQNPQNNNYLSELKKKLNLLQKQIETNDILINEIKEENNNEIYINMEEKNKKFIENKKNKIKSLQEQCNLLRISFTNNNININTKEINKEIKKEKEKLEILEKNSEKIKNQIKEEQENKIIISNKINNYDENKESNQKFLKNYQNYEKNFNDILEKEKNLINMLSELTKKNKNKFEELEKEQNKLNKDLQNIITEIENLKTKICELDYDSDLEDDNNIYINTQKEKENLEKEINNINKLLKEEEKYLESLKNHKYNPECNICMSNNKTQLLLNTEKNIKEYEEKKIESEKKLKKINKKYDIYSGYHTKYIQEKEKEETNKEINIKIQEKVKASKILKEKIEFNKEQLSNYKEIKTNLDILQKEKIDIKEKLNNHKKYNILHEEYENNKITIGEIEKIIKDLSTQKELNKATRENLITKIKEKENIIIQEENNEKIKKEIKDIEKEISKEENKEYEEYNTYHNNKNKLAELELFVANNNPKIKDFIEEITKQEEFINKIKQKKILEEEYINTTEKYNSILEEKNKCNKEKETIKDDILKLTNDINVIEEKKKELDNKKICFDTNDKIIDIIKNGFMDNLLTKKVIPNICSDVNNILSHYVNFKINMEYKEKKVIVYKKDPDGSLSHILKSSGYQETMINIALRLLINNINKLVKTNFYVMDESLASADTENTLKFQNLFEYMKKMFDFVIIISHDDQIKDFCDMDLIINSNNGFSCINYIDNNKKYDGLVIKEEIKEEIKKKVKEKIKEKAKKNTKEKTKIKTKEKTKEKLKKKTKEKIKEKIKEKTKEKIKVIAKNYKKNNNYSDSSDSSDSSYSDSDSCSNSDSCSDSKKFLKNKNKIKNKK
jgi:DNA repair exonuclease SbcCD ATPase subunit/predicted MPP superfamily phosphohydrolase